MSAHKKAAEQILDPLTNDEKDVLAVDRDMQFMLLIGMTRANALATLELAEQQRIANMQMERGLLWQKSGRTTGNAAADAGGDADALDIFIREGLGIS